MVVIDTKFLTLMLYPKVKPPKGSSAQRIVERLEDRIEKLQDELDSESERIIVPTPVLSEFLILAGDAASGYLEKLAAVKNILIKPFDEMAAIELAAVEVEDRKKGDKRGAPRPIGRR
jgi:predicted nucleic acid-binding protein